MAVFFATDVSVANSAIPLFVHNLVSACTRLVALSSGLLPAHTLYWGQQVNKTTLGIYVLVRRWHMQMEKRHDHAPIPTLVFVGSRTTYKILP